MIHEMRNPAPLAAARASEAFCLCTEHSEDKPNSLEMQGDFVWSPADLRLATGGPSECEIELLDCTPAASDPQMHALLWGIGVRDTTGLHVEPIVFVHNNRFELARRARDASDAVLAVVFLARDDFGGPLDLVAWEPETGRLAPRAPAAKSVPKSLRLLMDVVAQALDEAGSEIRAFGGDGPKVRAVAERHIRKLYFDRIAEQADSDEDADKLYDRQRVSFKRAIKSAIDAKLLVADECGGERVIWLP